MTTNWDVIVVGGGLAGLAAGATAAKGGARTMVLDAGSPGGRARTAQRDGFVLNMGAHALYLGGEGIDVLRGLGVTPVGSPPPLEKYKVLVDGQLHQMPAGAGSLLRTTALSARSKATLAKLLALLPKMRPADLAGVSVDEWIADRSLRPDAERVLEALIRIGTYADDLSTLSAEAAVTQLQRASAKGVVYLDGGWAQLIDALAAQVEVRGGVSVRSVASDGGDVVVSTDDEQFVARAVIVAAGTPRAAAAVLGGAPASWGADPDLGGPVTAACLDAGVRGVPSPGYVLGVDEPVYGTTQSPPARQAPPGDAVVAVIRYGARSAERDRPQLEQWLRLVGVRDEDIVTRRFLARMVVTGAAPLAATGGLAGRPSIASTGMENVFLAGDWVGDRGLLADASFASADAAARAAVKAVDRSATMVG